MQQLQGKLSGCSEFAVVLHTLDSVVVSVHGLVDVVGVGGVTSSLFLVGVSVSFGEDFTTSYLVFFDHLHCENVVDLDVMRRNTVVQEVGREHHVVARVPELWVILAVEVEHIAGTDESEASHDA